jgi:predicted dehydrogenase
MPHLLDRRQFVGAAAATGLSLSALNRVHTDEPSANDRLIVGVMGTGGRGTELAKTFARQPGVSIAYTCDVDKKRALAAAGAVAGTGASAPQDVQEYRRILDDKKVDILVVATCNHWHAPAAILGCAAEKHVYVEKPCCHNPQEGEWMVAAARKHKCNVQMGNQRRSWPKVIEAMEKLRSGIIGRVYFAQSWYANNRSSIGHGKQAAVPDGLDYDTWQGPAPRMPFHTNYLHYNWHWFWHWGNGELGNNGIHYIDLCRWGLGVDFPSHVSSSGGRYRYEDDQETPDTHVVSFDFGDRKTITWEGFSCNQIPNGRPDVLFQGENGSLTIQGNGYTIFDPKGKEIQKSSGPASDDLHIGNLLAAVRKGVPLNSEIEEGHKSTLLCHLGNIAHRTGRALKCDPKNGRILDSAEAMKFWQREYEKGWEPKV